ncbi:hypothetical protein [Derxia lacustris]|uniref:hypothetical protein n=1 Tax=Derxia lacustris TaxID=764842 RepID=UPI00111C854D|nr:hypothetical protein [Derxia lacustris]
MDPRRQDRAARIRRAGSGILNTGSGRPAPPGAADDTLPREALWRRDELVNLLTAAGTLAGLCITVVALMKTLVNAAHAATIVDDLFALGALLFLLCVYVIFWALRTRRPGLTLRLTAVADTLFLAALTLMTGAAFVLVYTVW